MKNYKMVLIGIFIILIVGFSQCGYGEPPGVRVVEPISIPEEVIYHPMGNRVSCYTWRAQLECLQVSE